MAALGTAEALKRSLTAKGSQVPLSPPSRGRHPSACDLRLPNGDDISEAVSRGTRSADVFRILRTLLAPYFQPIAVYSVARPQRAAVNRGGHGKKRARAVRELFYPPAPYGLGPCFPCQRSGVRRPSNF